MTRKGVLILTHIQSDGSSTLGKVLNDRGFRIKTLNTPRINMQDIDALRPDLLIVMGGPVGAYQKDDYPFLKDEIEILKKRLDADLPTIGICLGSQLMAAALNAKVFKSMTKREVGWNNLEITAEGQKTAVRHLDGTKTKMFHWHGDTFELPKNTKLLASSDQYKNQIFQSGHNGLAIQCHPEVRTEQLKEWFVMFTEQITGDNPLVPIEKLRSDTEKYIETLKIQAELFFKEWLEEREL